MSEYYAEYNNSIADTLCRDYAEYSNTLCLSIMQNITIALLLLYKCKYCARYVFKEQNCTVISQVKLVI